MPAEVRMDSPGEELEELHRLSAELPSFLQMRMHDLAGDVKGRYRTLIAINWVTLLFAVTVMTVFSLLFNSWVVKPLRGLIKGSRRIAGGEFEHRIETRSRDEIAELAAAMNDMTTRFREIRDDLDHKVKVRTRQVVRSEQLASVGFLAAGVAHEINNPLASIAWCAESLEARLGEHEEEEAAPAEPEQQELFRVLRHYLHMIQTEAFRCKEITEKLLDFSRLGNVKKHSTDLQELVQGVLEMISHLGKYRDRHVTFTSSGPVLAQLNPQEIKQVVLNLVTNGLDSLQPGGTVALTLSHEEGRARLVVADDGCGMSDEVLKHLFEPFFTRRQNGQGTGLGLSISYRIVEDHGGSLEPHSEGPGRGSRFELTLPLAGHDQEDTQEQAA